MASPLSDESDFVAPHARVHGIRVAILSRSRVFLILELLKIFVAKGRRERLLSSAAELGPRNW